jgi:hypothetical protein
MPRQGQRQNSGMKQGKKGIKGKPEMGRGYQQANSKTTTKIQND